MAFMQLMHEATNADVHAVDANTDAVADSTDQLKQRVCTEPMDERCFRRLERFSNKCDG